MRLSDVLIVLARPQEAGNVGAVCRAMMNMGLARLRVVPGLAGLPAGAEIRVRAVHAAEIWERAEFFPSLDAALADVHLAIGATRRTGERRIPQALDAAGTAAYLRDRPGNAALVFGNERTGLDAAEMRLCSLAAFIPASGAFPSLNLSHAVQIFCYELFRVMGPHAAKSGTGGGDGPRGMPGWIPLERAALDALVLRITDSLEGMGFYRQPGRDWQERFFRDLLARAAIGRREGEYLARIFAKAAALAVHGSEKGQG